jgi:exodeoxyribonuclease VII large subunit
MTHRRGNIDPVTTDPLVENGTDTGDVEGPGDTFTVTEVVRTINDVLRHGFGRGVWVRGEIQGWKGSGVHAYFELVEQAADAKATINAAMFAGVGNRLRPVLGRHRLELADGLEVRMFGTFDVYAPSGRLSFKVTDIDPRFTLGELALEREAVLQRLREAGLHLLNPSLPVPAAPLRIGLVTSHGSAAWADFTHELRQSGIAFHVSYVDVRVQGPEAPDMICAALDHLGARDDLDVIAVVRGGGARNDLAAFDDESVALAVARCPIPVFSGIGHEVDRSIVDEVAGRAFKTPTACAAAIVDLVSEFATATEAAWEAIRSRSSSVLDAEAARLASTAGGIRLRTVAAVDGALATVREHGVLAQAHARRVLDRHEARLAGHGEGLARSARRVMVDAERTVDHIEDRVTLLDPARTLARGWSITRGPDGRAINDASALDPGDVIVTTFARGSTTSRVEEVR